MNEIQVFNNLEFGSIRTVTIDNEPWFVGKDIAEALGYSNSSKAVMNHVDVEDKETTMADVMQMIDFIYAQPRGRGHKTPTYDDFIIYQATGGTDFMANVRNQINDYWNGVDQDVILAILKGIFGMAQTGTGAIKTSNAAFVDAHTLDISASTTDAKTDATMCMDATTLNTAIQKACGDNKQKFKLVYCHSAVATNLENLKLLAYLKYTDADGMERDLEMGTWNGRLVVIDDSLPVEVKHVGDTGGDVSLYTTYILGEGAIGFEDVGAKVPYEMVRDAKTRGGEDTLISRKRHAVSVAGISYTKASQATNSPTNAELETGKNWSLVASDTKTIEHKAVPIARIISRG